MENHRYDIGQKVTPKEKESVRISDSEHVVKCDLSVSNIVKNTNVMDSLHNQNVEGDFWAQKPGFGVTKRRKRMKWFPCLTVRFLFNTLPFGIRQIGCVNMRNKEYHRWVTHFAARKKEACCGLDMNGL
eukprot:gb/GEZJ01007250.1/.p2 GENE.gb/GEZJ01007250.1/~~gb/GEZJ01007250.1/.p2  ORF type:complete len:129 (+),score=20.10 gb/GEZJ01007250.1/:81-467(+)